MRNKLIWSLVAAGTVWIYANSALAAPVVMLQFGSYESEAEAKKRLDYMKTKHAGILGDMPSLVREVKTPYGSTVYRTQVGPLAGRPQAQSVCAQLVSSGDNECYIVETALPQNLAASPAVTKDAPAQTASAQSAAPASTAQQALTSVLPQAAAVATAAVQNSSSLASKNPALANALPQAAAVGTAMAAASLASSNTQTPATTPATSAASTGNIKQPAAKVLGSTVTATAAPSGAKILAGGTPEKTIPLATGETETLAPPKSTKGSVSDIYRTLDTPTETPATTTVAKAAALPTTAATPAVAKTVAAAAPVAAATAAATGAAPSAPITAPSAVMPADTRVASAAVREPITETAKAIKQGSAETVASRIKRDPETAGMLASVGSSQPQPITAPPISVIKKSTSAPMQNTAPSKVDAALAEAVASQPRKLEARTPKTVDEATRETSWFDDINPFSDDDAPAKKPSQLSNVEAPESADEEESFLDSINPFSDSPAQKAKNTVLGAREPNVTVPPVQSMARSEAPIMQTTRVAPQSNVIPESNVGTPALAVPVLSAPQEMAAAPTALVPASSPVATPAVKDVAVSNMRLPPPPLPDSETDRAVLSQQLRPLPAPGSVVPQVSAPVTNTVTAAPSISAAPIVAPTIAKGTSITEAARVMDAHRVQVEEARRVPLTEGAPAVALPPPPVMASSTPATVAASDMPSQSNTLRTLWAHISYFDSQQQALAFWEKFRQANPDFPSVRVRVTTPYVAKQYGNPLISLRVGPFGSQAFINELCDSDTIDSGDYDCTPVNDVGSAPSSTQPRMVQAVGTSPGRYGAPGKGLEAREGYWVQLGSYDSQERAQSAWQGMKLKHAAALRAMQAQLSTPPQGSHETPVYRLRTGPLLSQMAAQELCQRLKTDGASCLVVSEQ